jgi:hypothetical protein
MLIIIVVLFFGLLYYMVSNTGVEVTGKLGEVPEELIESSTKILVNDNYVSMKDNGVLVLEESGTIFDIVLVDKKKIALKVNNKFLSIHYLPLYKEIYEVLVDCENIQNITCHLMLKKKKKNFYIKFYNGLYLCTDSGILCASKDKHKIAWLKFDT